MNETFVYRLGENLYVNLTNKCCNACSFCIRLNGDGIDDSGDLWLRREPTADEVIERIKESGDYRELVFCGYGEPTYKMEQLLAVAEFAHSMGKRTRLNTNGLANLINGKNVVPDLVGRVDEVSVSLNSDTADGYDTMCNSQFGKAAYAALLDFTAQCAKSGITAVMSVVAVDGVNIDKCREIAAATGAKLRVREYIA